MNLSSQLAFIVLACLALDVYNDQRAQPAQPVEPPPIRIEVGPGKAVTVTIPAISKDDLNGILATFFTRDHPEVKQRLQSKLAEASDLTLVLTSKR